MRAVCVAVGLVLAAPVRAQRLDDVIAAAEALGVRTGVVVRDVGAATPSAQHRGAEVFAPASNQKLLTAAAVLHGLGADFEFATVFRLRRGQLQVVASGDPNWITGTDDAPLTVFAQVA